MFSNKFLLQKPEVSLLSSRVEELRQQIRCKNPETLANLSGVRYRVSGKGKAEFLTSFFGNEICICYPDLTVKDLHTGKQLPLYQQALIMYYLVTSDGTSLTDRWISFSELPDGRFYQQAFHNYSGNVLSNMFQNDLRKLEQIAQDLGGERDCFSQSAFRFYALPRAPLLVVYWQGDEEFPSSCQILFDASISHYLPTDACAILGKMLTQQFVKMSLTRKRKEENNENCN